MAFEGTLQEFTIRMHGHTLEHPYIEAQQGDTASRKVRIHLKTFDGADFFIPYGATAVLSVNKSDGHKILNECEIEDSSTVIITLTSQTLACPGKQLSQIYLFTDDWDIKTQNFYIHAPKAAYDGDAIKSTDEFGILVDMLNRVKQLEADNERIKEAEEARAAAFEERIGIIDTSISDANAAAERANEAAEKVKNLSVVELEEEISRVKSDFNELRDTLGTITFDENVTGVILNGSAIDTRTEKKGVVSTSFPKAMCTDFIDVSDRSSQFYYTGWVYYFLGIAGYDENKNYVGVILDAESATNTEYTDYLLTIPSEVKYIRATSYCTATGVAFDLVITKVTKSNGIVDDVNHINEYLNKNADRILALPKMNYIYVSVQGSDVNGDGTKDNPFATIYHANEMINDNSYYKRYTIKVADGTYTDLQTRYAGTYSGKFEGVLTKDYVEYIGNIENPENVVIQWDGLTGFNADTFVQAMGNDKCPFHVIGTHMSTTGGMHTAIRGFTIDAKNIRYAMHIEMSGYGKNVDWEISDCIFKWHGTPDMTDKNYQTPTIGTGSGHFEKGKILRCKIVNDAGITDSFRNHDSQYRYGDKYAVHEGAEITFESCVFDGGASGATNIMFRNIHSDNLVDGYNRFNIVNCKGIKKLGYQLSGNATVCDWRANVKCSDISNNVYDTENLLQ